MRESIYNNDQPKSITSTNSATSNPPAIIPNVSTTAPLVRNGLPQILEPSCASR